MAQERVNDSVEKRTAHMLGKGEIRPAPVCARSNVRCRSVLIGIQASACGAVSPDGSAWPANCGGTGLRTRSVSLGSTGPDRTAESAAALSWDFCGLEPLEMPGPPSMGHKPFDCKGHCEWSPTFVAGAVHACDAWVRHCPGLAPNRLLKHLLNRPR